MGADMKVLIRVKAFRWANAANDRHGVIWFADLRRVETPMGRETPMGGDVWVWIPAPVGPTVLLWMENSD